MESRVVPGVTASNLLRRLPGVLHALRIETDQRYYLERLSDFFRSPLPDNNHVMSAIDPLLTLKEWTEAISSTLPNTDGLQPLALLVLGISYLSVVTNTNAAPDDLNRCWCCIRDGRRAGFLRWAETLRSAQGHWVIPLYTFTSSALVDEWLGLQVWLGDSQHGAPPNTSPVYHPLAENWVLAGKGKHASFSDPRADSPAYRSSDDDRLSQTGKQDSSASYTREQPPSNTKSNEGSSHADAREIKVHSRGMARAVPKRPLKTAAIAPSQLHAIIFYTDTYHGPPYYSRALSPRDSRGVTAESLFDSVEAFRSWEILMAEGRAGLAYDRHEFALKQFEKAVNACTPSRTLLLDMSHHQCQAYAARGEAYRRFGRYEQAKNDFMFALASTGTIPERASWNGHLGTVLRNMGHLKEAQDVFEKQYKAAENLRDDLEMCRAIGDIGMTNYQLFLRQPEPRNPDLLDIPMAQLSRQVELARQLECVSPHDVFPSTEANGIQSRSKMESVDSLPSHPDQATSYLITALSRLSLCHTERSDHEKAVASALEGLRLARNLKDSTMLGMSRFFYGRALRKGGRPPAAYYAQFNPSDGATPAAALCREPSVEHRGYLQELVDAEAAMGHFDQHGYTALDYAVFAGDVESENIVLEGMKKSWQKESRIRQFYRELFLERLRPVLEKYEGACALARLRQAYGTTLEESAETRRFLSQLKSVKYLDFCKYGRLPRSSDGLAHGYETRAGGQDMVGDDDFFVFFSYRWINTDKKAMTPDDQFHTQYRRMLAAIEGLLRLHPEVSRDRLRIWMDNPATGVSALPFMITQCDAFISLTDESYDSRAWCCVEALIIQALERKFKAHRWYEHVQDGEDDVGVLRPAPDMSLSVWDKDLTYEVDRSSVVFLEQQAKLLA